MIARRSSPLHHVDTPACDSVAPTCPGAGSSRAGSYEWLAPTLLDADFVAEIGARRLRLKKQPEAVIAAYNKALNAFAALAARVVRRGGYVAVVLGQPGAKAYRDANAAAHLDMALRAGGFEEVWQKERVIHWHRNHGYARLKKERVSVHVRV